MSRRGRLAGPLLLVAGALLALGAAEGIARLVERARFPQLYRPYNLGYLRYAVRTYRPSLRLGYEPVPGADGRDSRGFRNREFPARKTEGVFRLMLAGDSLAERYGPLLQEVFDGEGSAVEVWDLGVGGYNLRQYADRLLEDGLRYAPDAVLLFHCLNDVGPNSPTLVRTDNGFAAVWGAGRAEAPASWLWPLSSLYRLAVWPRLAREPERAAGEDYKLAAARERLHAIRAACAARRIPMLSVVFPFLMPRSDYDPGTREGYSLLRRALSAEAIPFVDLHGAVPEARLRSLRADRADPIHLSDEAALEEMRRVRRALAERGIIPLPPSLKES